MVLFRIHSLFVFLFYISINATAQNCEIFLYTTEDGLPQNNLSQLMFDKNNRLWIGTQGGLCVFDGHKIEQVKHNNLSPRITYIHKDGRNDIYICDGKQNIYKANLINYKIHQLNQIPESYYDWIFNSSDYNKNKSIEAKNHYRNFIINRLGYRNFKYFGKNNTQHYVKIEENIKKFETFFLLDTTLIGITPDKKLIVYYNKERQIPITTNLPSDFSTKGFLFNSDDATFCLYNKTIYKLKLNGSYLKFTPFLFNVSLDPILEQINSGQFNPKTGFFYFGSSTNGLFEVIPSLFNVKTHKTVNKHPLIVMFGNAYYSQSEIDSNTIFVNNYTVIKDTADYIIPNVIYPHNRAANMLDRRGWLWYSDDQNIIIQKVKQRIKISLAPLNHPIISMTEISTNKYLLLNPHYIIVMDTAKEIQRFKLGTFKDSSYEYAQYIYFDKSSEKLYMLSNKNIYNVNLKNGEIEPNSSLIEADYRIMTPFTDSIKFVGSYGQGQWLKLGDRFVQMPLDKNQYLKFAHAALLDVSGYVWISTNNGLFRTRLQDMTDYADGKSKDIFYYHYDKSSGFLTNEFNGGCQSPAIKLRDGRFSFSSMDGLVQFDPLKVPTSFPLHQPNIIDLKLNNQSQDSVPTSLVITQDIKDIKLEVSTTFYGHPNNLQIQYKIPGYVDRWTDLTDQRYINLQNATYGDYTIEIRQRIGFGSHDFEYISYPLVVLPYFYQTWWFIAILSVIGLSLAYIFSRWYSRYMIQKNKELEMLILERNKEVLQTNEVLQEQVKQNDLFQSIFVHDIKSPIRFISSNTALLKTHWNHLDTTIKQDQISHIHDAATKIDHFIEETLLWIKIRNGELQLETNDFQALAMIQECIDFHKESDKIIRGDIQILADVHQDLYLTQDERLLATIIRNLISNSIKYTAHGKIIVYFLSKPNGSFTIGCKDTGKGMPKSLVEKLLSDHYRGNDIRDDSFKMGYVIIKEIVRLIGGQLHIESEENHGTHVWVEI